MKNTPSISLSVVVFRSQRGLGLLVVSYVYAYILLALTLASMTQTTVTLRAATQTLGHGQALASAEGALDGTLASFKQQYGGDLLARCKESIGCVEVVTHSNEEAPKVFEEVSNELLLTGTGTSSNSPGSQEDVQVNVTLTTSFVRPLYAAYASDWIQINDGGGTNGTGSKSSSSSSTSSSKSTAGKTVVPPGDVAFSGDADPMTDEATTAVELTNAKIYGTVYATDVSLVAMSGSSVTGGVEPLNPKDQVNELPDFTPPPNCKSLGGVVLGKGETLVLEGGTTYCADFLKVEDATVETDGNGLATLFVTGVEGSADVDIKKSVIQGIGSDKNVDARYLMIFVQGDASFQQAGTNVAAVLYARGNVDISHVDFFLGSIFGQGIKLNHAVVTYPQNLGDESFALGPADLSVNAWEASTGPRGDVIR